VKLKGRSVDAAVNVVKIKQSLEKRKAEIEDALLSREDLNEAKDDVQDLGDKTLSSTLETLRLSLQDNRIDEHDKIEKALGRIDKGEYGSCVDCHEPIRHKRLMANPHAARCVPCQEDFEGSVR
jgi:DnaK suppressor protein